MQGFKEVLSKMEEEKFVYVVEEDTEDSFNYYIYGVFSTEAKACAFLEKIGPQRSRRSVRAWPVDIDPADKFLILG